MDDPNEDSQEATQQATQNALDPRRLGKQNSGFSDEDISDIICLLYPNSDNATREVQRIANASEYSPHITGRYTADAIDSDLYREDAAGEFGRTRGMGEHAIVLKLSTTVKSPQLGFAFGRNGARCDICFHNDPLRRLSNIHFRIYVNKFGVVLLEDQSTNGTIVDDVLLKKRAKDNNAVRRVLESGSTIKVFMHENAEDLVFLVRIPRRDGELEAAYQRNLQAHLRRLHRIEDPDRTIQPGDGADLMPPPFQKRKQQPMFDATAPNSSQSVVPREWRGGEKYNRVGAIGKGAFATVYKVTSKYDGLPYAAKELDKRKFIKNGVLDQKVENEMRIMQRVQHPNIVQYIEHFDWDAHQFFIIMEYIQGGDLGKLVQENNAIREPYVKIMARQLVDALGYLHDNKITHRDVKPDNILIQSTAPLVVKLTDFGLSKMIDTEQTFLKTFCGTLLYCAPEVYSEYSTYDDQGHRVRQRDRRPVNRERYDHAVDIWSLGGVLFYALSASPPFPVKNGISYTELLHHIMTRPLDVRPLMQEKVTDVGIDFLRRMIDRRPETRATITELKAHPWLNDEPRPSAEDSFDEISDDELEQGASQLSLRDQEQKGLDNELPSELLALDPALSVVPEENKENQTIDLGQPGRLWGEVNNEALGSSGAVGESLLNLPVSDASLAETEILEEAVILDSFESENLSTPRQKPRPARNFLAASPSPSNGNSRSVALGIGSQSLGGAESILENLNMKSLARTESGIHASAVDLNTSKRKPGFGSGDEYDHPGLSGKPSFKRLKSGGDEVAIPDDELGELGLFACIPPILRSGSGRQMDYPVHKTTFWDGANKQSWHLQYPEMTHLQYAAFTEAAQNRNEDFSPGKSPLWDLAMKYFPPTGTQYGKRATTSPRSGPSRGASRSPAKDDRWELPPSDSIEPIDDEQASLPDTLVPDSQFTTAMQAAGPGGMEVARLLAPAGSLVKDVCISMVDPILSWGRERDNLVVYRNPQEVQVPKYAFRIVLWREGYMGAGGEFRPWERARSVSSTITTTRASPEPESYAFYISTKATNGLIINGAPLRAHEPKSPKSPSKNWMKLHHGDKIVFWGTLNEANQARLDFECYWGGSSARRPLNEEPACVPETVARKLDSTWSRAEKNLHHDRMKAEANYDIEKRMLNLHQEQDRSRAFEKKRAEVVKILALRMKRQDSQLGAPTTWSRTVPHFGQGTPAVQGDV